MLELRKADSSVLFHGTADGQSFSMSLLDGRLKLKGPMPKDPKALPPLETSGDSKALKELKESAEYRLLPHLSRALGERGITGRSHPASLGLHFFGMASASAHKVRLPPLEPKASAVPPPAAPAAASTVTPAPVPTGQCFYQPGDPCDDDCFGMCGADCNCWGWVCGDCCVNTNCLQHDVLCSACECGVSAVGCVFCYVPIQMAIELCLWQTDPCPDYAFCGCSTLTQCSKIEGTDCGWCVEENYSVGSYGSQSGPNNGLCKNWIWYHEDCECKDFDECDDIQGTDCGWCTTPFQQAMPGSSSGPDYHPSRATCQNWIWDHRDCNCAAITKCTDIKGTDCGWCKTLQQAMPGSQSGPDYQPPGGECTGSNWIWSHDYC